MTIRLLAHVPRDAKPIMRLLQEYAKDELELVFSLGDKDADIKASSLSKMSSQLGRSGHLMSGTEFTGTRHAVISSPSYFEDMERFIDQLQRAGPAYSYKANNLQNLQDYIDYYHILLDVVADRIVKSRATHMLFFDLPHLGYDTVFYQTGLALGLKPILLTQSLFPGKFFSMEKIYDFGLFPTSENCDQPYKIEGLSDLNLFYMKNIRQGEQGTGRITPRSLINLLIYIALKEPKKFLKPLWILDTIKRISAIYGVFPKWRDPFARFFNMSDIAYFEHLSEFEQKPIDLKQKFVYFALQLQPEMTTSAIGQKYRDQVLAIEDLARILPPDVKIYVKENPKQMGFARGPMYFHRMSRIKTVEMMPSYANTHSLTDAAVAVATISGTVGWEALCKKKRVICFGHTWYSGLPGVLTFDEHTTWSDIQDLSVNHADLEQSTGTLVARAHHGILHRHYMRELADFDNSENQRVVAQTILSLLRGEADYTFPSNNSADYSS